MKDKTNMELAQELLEIQDIPEKEPAYWDIVEVLYSRGLGMADIGHLFAAH